MAGIEAVDVVPGRTEMIDEGQKFPVVVDSASTPAALTRCPDAHAGALVAHSTIGPAGHPDRPRTISKTSSLSSSCCRHTDRQQHQQQQQQQQQQSSLSSSCCCCRCCSREQCRSELCGSQARKPPHTAASLRAKAVLCSVVRTPHGMSSRHQL